MESLDLILDNLKSCKDKFDFVDDIALHNQKKVMRAFQDNNIALRHFNGTSGYGYDDVGRDALSRVFASIFSTQSALVSPSIASGTHAISLSLFGLLRPNQTVLSISGSPYDTLNSTIFGKDVGSLLDFNINFEMVDLLNNDFDYEKIRQVVSKTNPALIYLQRSRGYEWRNALSIEKISKVCSFVKGISKAKIFVDNCYGEFVEKFEPTDVGADICAGSLIKNIGGGLCPTGGYIVGDSVSIDKIANRFTASGIGSEIGSYESGYRAFFQGLFLAPHTVSQAIKVATLFCLTLHKLGFDVKPLPSEQFFDIVCSVKFDDREKLVKFVQSIQKASPVDSFATPMPSGMPGYADEVVMAAGCFVQGSSIELSCDAPVRPPYIAYFQGGLTLEHGILALEEVLEHLE